MTKLRRRLFKLFTRSRATLVREYRRRRRRFFAVALAIIGILGLAFIYIILPHPTISPAASQQFFGNNQLNYNDAQAPTFRVDTDGLISTASTQPIIGQLVTTQGSLTVTVLDPEHTPVNLDTKHHAEALVPTITRDGADDQFIVSLPEYQTLFRFRPGLYTVEVKLKNGDREYTLTDSFRWGVLVMNFDRSTYKIDQEANIGMAVLDDFGVTQCRAKLRVEVRFNNKKINEFSTKDGTITTSETCQDQLVTNFPDYYIKHAFKENGHYQLTLSADFGGGRREISKGLEVTDSAEFTVFRHATSMRIYPQSPYVTQTTIEANQDFYGSVITKIPTVFKVSNIRFEVHIVNPKTIPKFGSCALGGNPSDPGSSPEIGICEPTSKNADHTTALTWRDVRLSKGDQVEISYTYLAPNVSPEFYLIGPVEMRPTVPECPVTEVVITEECLAKTASWIEPRAWQIAADSLHKFMAFWDGTTPPSGWVCVSCTGGDDFFQVFPRGAATAGGTGGAATHDHSQAFVSHTTGTTTTTNRGGTAIFTIDTHTHGYTGDLSGRTATATSLPIYQNLKVIRYDTVSNPPDIPDGVIVMFDADPGAGWTRYSAQDSDMIRGENDATGTGGSATHTHTFSGTLTDSADDNGRTGAAAAAATAAHTHTVSGTTDTSDHTPLYRDVLLYENTSGSAKSLVGGEIFMATGAPGGGWTSLSGSGGAFENRFLRGAATYGGTGGVANHTPANDVTTSAGPSATAGTVTGNPQNPFGGSDHTHDATNSFGSGNNLPPYRDTIIAKNTPGVSIQGVVFMANESTLGTTGNGGPCDGSTAVISIRIDGDTAATGSCNSSTAAFDIETNLGPSAGQTIAVYLTSTMKANTIYLSDGNADTGIDLYENRLAVGHKNAGPIIITDMDAYDSDQNDTDMLFDAEDAAPDTLIVESGNELHIRSGETFTPGGAVTTPNMHIAGTFSAGSFGHILNGTTGTMITLDAGGDLVAGTSNIKVATDANVTLTSGTFTGSDAFYVLLIGDTGTPLTTNRTYTFGSGEIQTNNDLRIAAAATTSGVTLTVNMAADITAVLDLLIQPFGANNPNVTLDTMPSATSYNITARRVWLNDSACSGVCVATLDAGGSTSVISLTLTNASTLFLQSSPHVFIEGNSEVRVTSASSTPSVVSAAETFHILTINSGGAVVNAGADITFNNDPGNKLHIQSGTFNTEARTITPGTAGELDIDSGAKLCVGGTTGATNATCDNGVTQTSNTQLPSFTTFTLDPNSTIRFLPNFNTYSVSNTPTYGNLELALKTADATQTWELGGAMTINGNFTLNPTMCASCTFDVDANGPITVASGKTTTIDEVGTGNSILDLNPDGTPRNLTTGNVSITSGNQLRVEGTGTSVVDVSETWTNNGIFGEGNSTVTLSGTTSTSFNSGCSNTDTCTDQNFYNLTIDKTDADEANDNVTLTTNGVRLTNLLTITNGELVQGALNVRAEGTSAVSIAAAGEWNNISTGDLKLGGTFVNEGTAIFNSSNGTQCVEAADDIAITSTSGGSQRAWSGAGTFTLRNLDVTDMTDSSITAYTSAFTNTTWTDGACGTIVSGGCFTDESEGTPCTDDGANAIKIAVNGVVDPASDPEVDGAWSVTVATLSANDILVIFVDTAADAAEATTVVKYDGTGNITNVKLYQSQLVIGTDSGSTNTDQTITVANLDTTTTGYENSDDEDVLYDVATGDPATLTVDAEANKTEQLYIMNGDTFRPDSGGAANTFTHNLEIDTGATITADGNNFTIGGSWNNGGTFTAGTSTVTFNTTVTGNTLSGTLNGASGFNNALFSTSDATATDDWEIQAAMSVANDFTLLAGNIDSNNNNLTVTRDYILTNAANTDYDAGSSTVTVTRHFNDVGNKYVRGTSLVTLNGSGNFNTTNAFTNLSIGFSGFTTTLNTSNFSYFGTMTFNGGTVSATGGWIDIRKTASSTPIVFAAATSLTGSKSLYHRNEASAVTTTIAGGNYGSWNIIAFITSGSSTSSTFELAGSVTTTGYFTLQATVGAANNVFNTLNQGLTASIFDLGSESRTATWTVNFGSSTFSLSSTGTAFGVVSNGGAHTLNLSTASISTAGSVKFANGTGSVTASGTTSTITMTPAASATRTFSTNGQTIDNFVVNGGDGAATVNLDGNLIASDNVTITAGTLDVTATPYNVTIGGNYTNSGSFNAQSGTVTLNGSTTQTLSGTMVGGSAFNNLTITNNSGTSASDCERTSFVPSVDFAAAAWTNDTYTITTANVRVEYNSGSTYAFTNINWDGQDIGTRIYFRNSAASGSWLLDVSGTQTAVSYVNVSRSNASGGLQILAGDGTNFDCNNNSNWFFIAGALSTDIVDAGGTPVALPSIAMSTATFSLLYQTVSGIFGVTNEKVRVSNTTLNPQWSLTIAASSGPTALWSAGTPKYDFNDPTGSAGDGGDGDTDGGQLTMDVTGGTLGGTCSATGITKGSSAAFSEGVVNSVTLLTASGTADVSCYWDLTGVDVLQTLPSQQAPSNYSINMTLTIVAN